MLLLLLFSSMVAYTLLFDHSSKMYHVSAYFIGNSLADLVLQLIYPIVFGTITYWVCGLHPDFSRFLVFLLILVVSTVVAQSLAHALSTVTKSQTVASTLGPVVITGYLLVRSNLILHH